MKKIYLTLTLLACIFSTRSFAQCSTPSVVPYHEGFNNFLTNNQLPTCWAVSNASTCLTYTVTNGNGYAAFSDSPTGSNFFYSRAIQLTAGITYSASAWYKISSSASNNWSDLSILMGTSQSSTGLVSIVSLTWPSVNTAYSPISNTFAVASSGVYYIAVRAISVNGSSSPSLLWDDFDIMLPCGAGNNSPSMTLTASSNTICEGQTYSATVTGADTYNWDTGATGASFTATPNQNMQYYVVGTKTLTGCSATLNAPPLVVNTAPNFIVIATKTAVCLGDNVGLQSPNSSLTFSWNTGATSSAISVTPAVTTVYTVTGTNSNGCKTSVNYTVNVLPLPVFTYSASVSLNTLCRFDPLVFTANSTSNLTYTWSTSQASFAGDTYSTVAALSNSVTLVGSDLQGCKKTTTITFQADNCSGLKTNSSSTFKVYPNPGKGVYILESGNSELKSVVITDLSGRVIFTSESSNETLNVNLEKFAAGVYYAKINSAGKTETIKLIKE